MVMTHSTTSIEEIRDRNALNDSNFSKFIYTVLTPLEVVNTRLTQFTKAHEKQCRRGSEAMFRMFSIAGDSRSFNRSYIYGFGFDEIIRENRDINLTY